MAAKSDKDDTKKVRAKALSLALSKIEKDHGKGAIMRLGESVDSGDAKVIPSGSLSLDIALGIGGIPRGRVMELFGPESSGKTMLALHIIAEAQKTGGIACFIDAEHALDKDWAALIGVNVDELLISQPDYAEQALDIAETLIRSNSVDVVVIDSVAALVPKAEVDGEMGDMQIGLQARLMSKALRKLSSSISKSKTSLLFINQLREKIGVMFGNPETTPGGRALKFYASVRIEVKRIESIKDATGVVGHRVRARIVKNKVAAPFKIAEFDILYAEGISNEGTLIDLGMEAQVITRTGSWYSYKDAHIGQGRESARRFLKENPDVAAAIRKELVADAKSTKEKAAAKK